jgi:hypothetical protein
VKGMLPIKGTVLIQFQLFLGVPPILGGGVIPPLTFAALKRHQFHDLFLARHTPTPSG